MTGKPRRPRGTGSIFVKRGIYWVKYHAHGIPYRESTRERGKKGRTAAENLLKRRTGQIYSAKFAPAAEKLRIADLRKLVEDDYAVQGRKSIRHLTAAFDHLEEFFGHAPATEIPRRMSAYLAARTKEEAGAGTIRREVAAVRRAYSLAARDGLVPSRPVLATVPPAPPRQGFVDDKTVAKLVAALPVHLKPYVSFLYLTAWRRGEAAALTWKDVDLERGEIRLHDTATKTGAPRVLPFHADPRLDRLVREQAKRAKAWRAERGEIVPLVFWRDTPEGAKPIADFRDAWDTARKAAGKPGLLVHDLRRSRARAWSEAGVPDRVAMDLGGWKTRSVLDRYRIVAKADMEEALRRSAAADAAKPAEKRGRSSQ